MSEDTNMLIAIDEPLGMAAIAVLMTSYAHGKQSEIENLLGRLYPFLDSISDSEMRPLLEHLVVAFKGDFAMRKKIMWCVGWPAIALLTYLSVSDFGSILFTFGFCFITGFAIGMGWIRKISSDQTAQHILDFRYREQRGNSSAISQTDALKLIGLYAAICDIALPIRLANVRDY